LLVGAERGQRLTGLFHDGCMPALEGKEKTPDRVSDRGQVGIGTKGYAIGRGGRQGAFGSGGERIDYVWKTGKILYAVLTGPDTAQPEGPPSPSRFFKMGPLFYFSGSGPIFRALIA
jgi:hypothetical protein